MEIDKTGVYAIYLRKSRADIEAEKREQFETLAKHEQLLNELAARYSIRIAKVFKELVSGDTIASRPQMRQLLADVTAGVFDGVLVTEISRLARGNTTDQGVVAEAFKNSNTLIITPSKVYDPTDEADETFFDFELFMARQEYRYIKKRMQRGRRQSFENGNWIFSHVPVGYKKEGLRLVPGDNAEIMRTALTDLASGRKTKAETVAFLRVAIPELKWNSTAARNTLANPIYAGYLKRGKATPTAATYNPDEYIKANAEPLITLQQHADIVHRITVAPKTKKGLYLRNAFSGLIQCQTCGRAIVYNYHHGYPVLSHQYGDSVPKCQCYPVRYEKAYAELIDAILAAIPKQEYHPKEPQANAAALLALQAKLKKAEQIKSNLFLSFENSLYTPAEFAERKNIWTERINALKSQINALQRQAVQTARVTVTTDDLKAAIKGDNPEEVNALLKLLIDHIEYSKPTKKEEPVFRLFFK